MPIRHRHRVGRHLMEDEESGIVTYDDKIVKRWDGALVRRKAYETRHPQEFVRAKSDPKALKNIRPAQEADRPALGPTYFVGNTTVPAAKGIGHRLTRTGIGKMMIGGSFVIEGEPDDITVTAQPLKYNPNTVVPLTSATTYNVTTETTASRTVHLAAGEHAIITFASGRSPIDGTVRITGESGNNVWLMNPFIRNHSSADQSGEDHQCLNISNVANIYIEGARLDKGTAFGDAITYRGSAQVGGRFYMQNFFINGGCTVSAGGLHGDGLQILSQIRELNLYQGTFRGYSQGFLINSSFENQFETGSSIVSGANLERVNFVMRERAEWPVSASATSFHMLYMQDDCSATKITYNLSEVYVYDPGGRRVGDLCRPGPLGSGLAAAACGSYETWDTIYYPSSAQISGEVKQGLPAGGNFVNESTVGTNYSSPGYRST
jgi:hypothetical protein